MSSHLYHIHFYEFYLLLPFLVLQKRILLKTKQPVHYINTNNTFQKKYIHTGICCMDIFSILPSVKYRLFHQSHF